MTPERFDEAADEFLGWCDAVQNAGHEYVRQARESFEKPTIDDATHEQMAELILRQIQKPIEGVMHTFDKMEAAINMPQRYKAYFESQRLTKEGWRKLQEVFQKYREPEE